jgi:hypothetical protein
VYTIGRVINLRHHAPLCVFFLTHQVPPHRILTAFDTTPWNTFLGYFMDERSDADHDHENGNAPAILTKKPQGVIWGKDPK